jgi:hypothetical protein
VLRDRYEAAYPGETFTAEPAQLVKAGVNPDLAPLVAALRKADQNRSYTIEVTPAKLELGGRFQGRLNEQELAQVQDLLRAVGAERDRWRANGVDTEKFSTPVLIGILGKRLGASDKIIQWATMLRPGSTMRDILTGKRAPETAGVVQ